MHKIEVVYYVRQARSELDPQRSVASQDDRDEYEECVPRHGEEDTTLASCRPMRRGPGGAVVADCRGAGDMQAPR